jgi:hypothetical protein
MDGKMILKHISKETGYEDPVDGSCEHGNEPSGYSRGLLTSWETISFSRLLFHGVSCVHQYNPFFYYIDL